MLDALRAFAETNKFVGKGPLCVALVVTDHARDRGLPLDADRLVTEREGQVLGLGKAKVQTVLARHGITKVLASEGGRTSRGSMGNMRSYVGFLNDLNSQGSIDLDIVEAFWIDRVRQHFAAKPFVLRMDPTLSVRAVVRAFMTLVEARQKDAAGTMIVGTVMQHMVGAKLEVALKDRVQVSHHGSNVNDVRARGGDFDIGDASIHVTTAPGVAVIEKCISNLDAGRKPIIVTTRRRAELTEQLAEDAGVGGRIDVLEFEQFMAANIHELGGFGSTGRNVAIADIIDRYNAVILEYETDPSLMIELAGS